MTTILTFIIPALIVVLLSLPLVNVFKGKVTAKSAKMRLGTHICGFFGAVALVLFLTYANSPVLAAYGDAEVKAGDITIGGLIVENTESSIVHDETLEFALKNQKEWFNQHSGLIINK